MSVTFSDYAADYFTGSSATYQIDVLPGDLVFVLFGSYTTASGTAPSSVTANGVTLTASTQFSPANSSKWKAFTGITAGTGTIDVVCTASDGLSTMYAVVASTRGNHATAAIRGSVVTGFALSTAMSLTVSSAVGDMGLLLGFSHTVGNSMVAVSPATEVIDETHGSLSAFGLTRPGAASTAAIAGTLAQADWVAAAISVIPDASSNAAPTFSGPNIGNIAASAGVAITPVDVSAKFTDTDALAFTASPGGTAWPSGLSINSSTGVISGTVTAAGTTTGIKVRATDTASQTVDSNAFNFVNSAVTRTVTVTLTSDGTTPRASLTGLKWAWWDVVTPDLMTAAPTDKAATGTTNSSGVFTVSLPGSALSAGATGWLTVTNSTGSASQSPSALAFSGPVVVS